MTDKIILASQSPRRKELLSILGFKDFEIIPADIDEIMSPELSIGQAAAQVALSKAAYVKDMVGDSSLILAADTVVVLDGRVLGKPANKQDAKAMLRSLSGRTHNVCTGIALLYNGQALTQYETTHVSFRHLSDSDIDAYIASGEPMDKAGAYGAQGLAALFISRIEGDFFNVIGLPLYMLGKMLNEIGINVLDNLSK